MDKRTTVYVEYFYDDESQNWGFTSADPAIIGGGDRTLDAAARHFARALAETVQWEREEASEREQHCPEPPLNAGSAERPIDASLARS